VGIGNGELGKVTRIELIGNEIYYTLSLFNGFDNGGNLPIQCIQIKEDHLVDMLKTPKSTSR